MDTRRGDSGSPEALDRLAQAFRTERPDGVSFTEFLGNFDDAHTFDTSEANQAEILRRFEVFNKLPEIGKTLKELAKEKNLQLLGREFTEEELKAIDQELEDQIFHEHNFELIDSLNHQVHKYRELPKEIMQWQLRLVDAGDRQAMDQQAVRLEHQIGAKEGDIQHTERSQEGMGLAKEGVGIAKKMEEGLGLAEQVFFREADVIFGNYQKNFDQLEASRQRLSAAGQKPPLAGKISLPDLAGLKANFLEIVKKKKDPADFLEALAGFSFASNLEAAKKQLRSATEGGINALRAVERKPKEATKYPELKTLLTEIQGINAEVVSINIDSSAESKFEGLNNDLAAVVGARQGLVYLQRDPGNRDICGRLERNLSDFQTTAGKQLASGLKFDFDALFKIQDGLRESPLTDVEVKTAAGYTTKGFMGRLVSSKPEKKLAKKLQTQTGQLEDLEAAKTEILGRIRTSEDAERELERRKMEFAMTKQALFFGLKSFGRIFKKSAEDAKAAINATLESEDLEKIIGAKQDMEKLARAKEYEPDLYGDDDVDDYYNNTFTGKRNLRDLRASYHEILTVKVEGAVKKALESLETKKINPDSLAAKLKGFEDGLGSLVNTPQYQRVRMDALRQLASPHSTMDVKKKLALRAMLNEGQRRGFVTNGNLDFSKFLKPEVQPARA